MTNFSDSWRAGGTGRGSYILQTRSASGVPLVAKGAAGQTASLFECQDSAGTAVFTVSVSGNVIYLGDEYVTDQLTVHGNAIVDGTLNVTGATSLASTLSVIGAAAFASTGVFSDTLTANALVVSNPALFSSTVELVGGQSTLVVRERNSSPGARDSMGQLYTKETSAVTELFYLDSSGNETQLTSVGAVGGDDVFIPDDKYLRLGNTSASPDVQIGWNTAQTVDALFMGLSTAQNTLIIAEKGDIAYDFAHGAQTNPTLYIQSATQSATQYGSLTHNQTNFVVTSGVGSVQLSAPSGAYVPLSTTTSGLAAVTTAMTPTATSGVFTSYGIYNQNVDNAVVTANNHDDYGIYSAVTKAGADTSVAATTLYGVYSAATNTGSTDVGTKNTYAGYFIATGDTNGTATAYGIYATAVSADTNYAAWLAGTTMSAGELVIGKVGVVAGDNSYHLSFKGTTSAAEREYDIYQEADAGTDTYRLTFANAAGSVYMTLDETGDLGLGDADIDCGTFTMIKGAQAGDPQVQFALSADANGNFSITADTGDITLTAADDFFVSVDGNLELGLTGTVLYPYTSDGLALGDTTHMWADLFLNTAGVINFNNGEVTVTEAATGITFAGTGMLNTVITQAAGTGVPVALTITGGAHTAITTATEDYGVNFNFSATKTWAAGAGPLATQREVIFQAPTYDGNAGGALTITKAATVAITNAPQDAGANITLTSAYALWVQAGSAQFDGGATFSVANIAGTNPALNFYDTDCADYEVSASIDAQATDTLTTQEDVDVTFKQKINGTLTQYLASDADGNLTVGYASQTIAVNGGNLQGIGTISNAGLITNTVGAVEALRLATNADDYTKFTLDANGGLTIQSVDAAAAAANIAVTADGTFAVTSTGFNLTGAGAVSGVTTLAMGGALSGVTTLGMAGDLTDYEATNDANPEFRLGAADAEELHIQAVYDGGAQTLNYIYFVTDAASVTADKGKYVFNVDGADIVSIADSGVTLATGMALCTTKTDTNTALIAAYDVDGGAYTAFITLTAGNTPTCVLASGVTGTTQAPGTNDTTLATTAFVTAAIATTDTLAEILAIGNTTGANDIIVSAGQAIKSAGVNGNTMLLKANDTTFITFTTNATDTCAISGATIDNCVIGGGTAVAGTFTTATVNTGLVPDANDGAYLGQAGTAFSDLFLAEGGVINWDSSDFTITQTNNLLDFAGGDVGIGAVATAGVRLNVGWVAETMPAATTASRQFQTGGNITELANAAITDIVGAYFNAFTITDGAGTETVAQVSTVYINNAPTVGSTPAKGPYALFVDAGTVRIDGSLGDTTDRVASGFFTDLTVTNAIAGSVTGNAATVTVADTADTSCSVGLFEDASGSLGCKTDTGLTYNAGTGLLTATGFSGPLTGDVAGNCSGTAASVTGATQVSITTCANLVTVGTISTGVWQGTTIKANYLQQAAADLGAANITVDLTNTNGAFVTNLTIDGTFTGGTFTDGIISITGGNLTGATGVTATTLTGTLATAAQANVTSLGTLTGLTLGGDLTTTATAIDWDLKDNDASALSFDTVGLAGLLELDTSNSAEKVKIAGSLYYAKQAYSQEIDDGDSGDGDTIDWTTGNNHKSTLTGNVVYTFTAPTGPAHVTLRMVQDGTGGRTVTWPGTVRWSGGTEPTWSTTIADENYAFFYYNGSGNYIGSSVVDILP